MKERIKKSIALVLACLLIAFSLSADLSHNYFIDQRSEHDSHLQRDDSAAVGISKEVYFFCLLYWSSPKSVGYVEQDNSEVTSFLCFACVYSNSTTAFQHANVDFAHTLISQRFSQPFQLFLTPSFEHFYQSRAPPFLG